MTVVFEALVAALTTGAGAFVAVQQILRQARQARAARRQRPDPVNEVHHAGRGTNVFINGATAVPTGQRNDSRPPEAIERALREALRRRHQNRPPRRRPVRRTRGAGSRDNTEWSTYWVHDFPDEEPTPGDLSTAAQTSAQALDQAMATLFLELGPPPEPTEIDYTPTSNGGGGAQQ